MGSQRLRIRLGNIILFQQRTMATIFLQTILTALIPRHHLITCLRLPWPATNTLSQSLIQDFSRMISHPSTIPMSVRQKVCLLLGLTCFIPPRRTPIILWKRDSRLCPLYPRRSEEGLDGLLIPMIWWRSILARTGRRRGLRNAMVRKGLNLADDFCQKLPLHVTFVDSRNSSKSYILQTLQNDKILNFRFRCNGQRPACSHCKRRSDSECVYQKAPNRRRPGKQRRQREVNRDIPFTSDILLPLTGRHSEKPMTQVWAER